MKCWQIRKGTKAPGAAGTIHTDFERGFICAEVMTYADLTELKNEVAVKAAGKYRQQGKEYVVQDGDVSLLHCPPSASSPLTFSYKHHNPQIIFFKFNVTSTGKK